MIKLSSGKKIAIDRKTGNKVFGHSKAHTILCLYLLCPSRAEAGPDADDNDIFSPWDDRPEVASGEVDKSQYIDQVYEGIDLVPPHILELVIKDMLDEDRRYKPSRREMQTRCRAAMQMEEDLRRLSPSPS
jgi:hypothetical protein